MANEQPSGQSDAARLGRESRRRLAKAGAADSHSSALIGAGAVMVTVGGVFMAVAPRSVWSNVWFDAGFGFLVVGLIVAAVGLYFNFRKPRPKSSKGTELQPVPKTGVPGVQSQEGPLAVRILDSDFEGHGSSAMFAAIHISVDNTTDRKIRVVGYDFNYENGRRLSWEHYANDEQRKDFQDKRRAKMQEYGPSLQLPAWIDAHSHVSWWILESVTRTPAGGTPACTVFIFDDFGNSYEAKIAGQEPQAYPAKN